MRRQLETWGNNDQTSRKQSCLGEAAVHEYTRCLAAQLRPHGQRCEAFLIRRHSGFTMVAEVVRLLGDTKNARILTNPATEILNGVEWHLTCQSKFDEALGRDGRQFQVHVATAS